MGRMPHERSFVPRIPSSIATGWPSTSNVPVHAPHWVMRVASMNTRVPRWWVWRGSS